MLRSVGLFFVSLCAFSFLDKRQEEAVHCPSALESRQAADDKAKQIKQKNHLGCCCHFAGDTVREQDWRTKRKD